MLSHWLSTIGILDVSSTFPVNTPTIELGAVITFTEEKFRDIKMVFEHAFRALLGHAHICLQ